MSNSTVLKLIITLCSLCLIIARWIKPDLQVDPVTIGLLVVAILPWLSSMLESAKFPGGWEIRFRDLQAASQKITDELQTPSSTPISVPSYLKVAVQDPNLALVGLRIEIERRFRILAERVGANPRSLKRLINEIQVEAGLTSSTISGLNDIIEAGNRAAHGARVEPQVADWALEYGPRILALLDEKLKE